MLDLLIRGGMLVDGTGAEPRHADVAVHDGRIVAVAPGLDLGETAHTVNATGRTVTPGFIDPHSHTDWSVLANRDAQSTIRQGVTTEVVGNCGVTYAPVSEGGVAAARSALAGFGYQGEVAWRSFGEYLEQVHGGGTAQNLAWLVGHTALREAAGVRGGSPTEEQAARVDRLLEEALEAGALGLSTGLEYGSGRDATTAELARTAAVVGRHGGVYASHIRNRDARLAEAVDEFFTVSRRHGLRAQLSHLNVRYGTGAAEDGWQQAVDRLQTEREAGLDVLADITPYPDGIGFAAGMLPDWLLADGPAAAADRLSEASVRTALRSDCDRYWRFIHRGQWQRVRLAVSPATPDWEGLSLPQISAKTGRDEWDCLFDILQAAGADLGAVQLMGELFTPDHLARAIAHPLFSLGVDGYSSRTDGVLATRTRHPLFFTGHTHYLAHHVLQRHTLPLAEAVRKMTSMVADHFGLAGRGRVVPGAHADLVVFDTGVLAEQDTSGYRPQYAAGVSHVLVNGAMVIEDGAHHGIRAGVQLRRSS